MEKLDLTKKYKSYYSAKSTAQLVRIEPAHFISITGKGDPSGKDFIQDIQTLYPVAYALKFMFKEKGKDFVVAKLEALWWFDEKKFGNPSMEEAPLKIPRSEWEYRLLIRLPDFVNANDVIKATELSLKKKPLAGAHKPEYFKMNEGLSVQILHTGPFDKEPESLQKILNYCKLEKLDKNGLHHEIYLSDFRKTAAEKLRTILREPVK